MAFISDDVSQLLVRWSEGDEDALNELMPLFYSELHRLAAHYMRGERTEHTLQATALVHEAYLELRGWRDFAWQNRAQFIGIAAQMMRRILTNYARQHRADKRGGGLPPLPIDEAHNIAQDAADLDLVAIDEALEKLETLHPLVFQVVRLKFYGGLDMEEISEVLQSSTSTVERRWRFGKAWLFAQLRDGRFDGTEKS